MRVDLEDNDFTGVSRSVTFLRSRSWPTCTRCGSTLSGASREGTSTRWHAGVRYVVDVFRCGCGRGRRVQRGRAAAR